MGDNHVNGFIGKDVEKILLDYTEDSVLKFYDEKVGEVVESKGLAKIGEFFSNLFELDFSSFGVRMLDVDAEKKVVFLSWKNPGVNISSGIDTFAFDDNFKVVVQTVYLVRSAS